MVAKPKAQAFQRSLSLLNPRSQVWLRSQTESKDGGNGNARMSE